MQDLQLLMNFIEVDPAKRTKRTNSFELDLYFKHEYHIQKKRR